MSNSCLQPTASPLSFPCLLLTCCDFPTVRQSVHRHFHLWPRQQQLPTVPPAGGGLSGGWLYERMREERKKRQAQTEMSKNDKFVKQNVFVYLKKQQQFQRRMIRHKITAFWSKSFFFFPTGQLHHSERGCKSMTWPYIRQKCACSQYNMNITTYSASLIMSQHKYRLFSKNGSHYC